MKKILIKRLEITAFKGISHLVLDLNGEDAQVRGRNGLGKTSVYDAFLWLLFGKDSTGATKFNVRPVDENGRELVGSDTVVSCDLETDDGMISLRRALHEKYKNLPNETTPIYAGVETLCWIDDVPVKLEKEFQPKVAGIVGDEESFKRLAIHGYFLRMPWEQRRKILMDAAGESPEAEILTRPEFLDIPGILQGKTVDEARKRLRDQIKRYTDEIKTIPSRIDELRNSMPDVTEEQCRESQQEYDRLSAEIEKINNLLSGGTEAYRQAQERIRHLHDLNNKLELRKQEIIKPFNDKKRKCEQELSDVCSRMEAQEREFRRMSSEADDLRTSISRYQAIREQYLAAWHKVNDSEYEPPQVPNVCSLCGQTLPASMIEETLEKSHRAWEEKKSRDLDEISAEGKTTAEKISKCQAELKGIEESLERKETFLAELRERWTALQEEKKNLDKPQKFNFQDDPEFARIQSEIDSIMNVSSADVDSSRVILVKQRSDLLDRQKSCMSVFTNYQNAQSMRDRICELTEQQKSLGASCAKAEGELDLLSRYNTACCSAVEDVINSMFTSIRWRLFEFQKNGEVKDCCTATVLGVPYDTGLNHAAQINAGIEAIRVLSKRMGVSVPCFVDNSEAVNNLEYTGGQMIKLVVTDEKNLTIVKEG